MRRNLWPRNGHEGAGFEIYGPETAMGRQFWNLRSGKVGHFWGAGAPKTLPAQAQNEPFFGTGNVLISLISGKPAIEATGVLFPQPQAMSHI